MLFVLVALRPQAFLNDWVGVQGFFTLVTRACCGPLVWDGKAQVLMEWHHRHRSQNDHYCSVNLLRSTSSVSYEIS